MLDELFAPPTVTAADSRAAGLAGVETRRAERLRVRPALPAFLSSSAIYPVTTRVAEASRASRMSDERE